MRVPVAPVQQVPGSLQSNLIIADREGRRKMTNLYRLKVVELPVTDVQEN